MVDTSLMRSTIRGSFLLAAALTVACRSLSAPITAGADTIGAPVPSSTCLASKGQVTRVENREPYLWVWGWFERSYVKDDRPVTYCQQHNCGFDGEIGKTSPTDAIARCERIARDFIGR
jgi:hypothetical protein